MSLIEIKEEMKKFFRHLGYQSKWKSLQTYFEVCSPKKQFINDLCDDVASDARVIKSYIDEPDI